MFLLTEYISSATEEERLLISFAKRRSLGSVNLVWSKNNWGFNKYDIVVRNGSKWLRTGHSEEVRQKEKIIDWQYDCLLSGRIIFHMFTTSKQT
jgi:hypothetical protein